MNVKNISFFLKSSTSCDITGVTPVTNLTPEIAGQPQAAVADGGATPQQRGLQRSATMISDGDDAPPVNRTTQLQAAWKANMDEFKKAVREGRYYSDSLWANQNTASSLKDALITILTEVLESDRSFVTICAPNKSSSAQALDFTADVHGHTPLQRFCSDH